MYPQRGFSLIQKGEHIKYLNEVQINRLTEAFQRWFDLSSGLKRRKIRGRYWLVFLVLRFTGARLGEVLMINDMEDIDFRNAEIKLNTLKRSKKGIYRIVPVPQNVVTEIATYIAEFPLQRGKIFKLDQGNFRKIFYKIAEEANIPKELSHPHILRHTRAIELIRAGVPITVVQDLLGHSSLLTTAIYLKISAHEAKEILKHKRLI